MAQMNGLSVADVLADEGAVTRLFSKVCALQEMESVAPDPAKASGMERHSACAVGRAVEVHG